MDVIGRTVRIVANEGHGGAPHISALGRSSYERLAAPLRRGIARTRQWLLGEQHADGYWVGELEGDTILESEYILLLAYLGRQDSAEARQAARYIIKQQLPEGGWAMYPGGQVEISGSVKAYFALKLTGHDPSAEYMQRARAAILAHGGADAVNSFTRFYLALLGQISYDECPAVPPEVMLLPSWFPINVYRVSSWSRTILVPLSIMSALQPTAEITPEQGIRELFLKAPADWPALRCPGLKGGTGLFSWDRFFRTVDAFWKRCQCSGLLPFRRRALRVAERWMVDRFEGSDGLGAIFPPMVWSVIALRALGYQDDSPELKYCYERLEGLFIEEDDTLRLQPCKSPVWDTAISLRALASSGVRSEHPSIVKAVEWLLDMQIHRRGDWSENVKVEPGGWCFEHANDYYPDIDDTIMVMMALEGQFSASSESALPPELNLVADRRGAAPETSDDGSLRLGRITGAIERAERWVLAMQNRDGGWGAFDRDNDHEFLCYVPFADHNAMIDPSTPDITARVLEALGAVGRRPGDPAVDRALAYLRSSQEADGSWFGRWGVNYIYGTWQVLVGLAAIGVPLDDPMVLAGANWLVSHQQPSGAWGESADSYADPHLRGQGPATASQTAWAVLGLVAAGWHDHPAAMRGVRYLLSQQLPDGTWDEPEFTGTGFPRVFYLRYHLYRIYFPLMALSRWAVAIGADPDVLEPAVVSMADHLPLEMQGF
ncbi:MAG TPA: terpene cyclase/mutase family protein [Pirellulales bacterium]|nr:terpene cyclase/mutase family protein [Pirellulales bacterium]